MKVIEADDDYCIRTVVFKGLRKTRVDPDSELYFVLTLNMGGGDAPTVSIEIQTDLGDKTVVELDECVPLEKIPRVSVSSDVILQLMGEKGDLKDNLLTLIAASSAKLLVRKADESIRFLLSIGRFRTRASVSLKRLEGFLTAL